MLGICSGILLGMLILDPPASEGGRLRFDGIQLPTLCLMRSTTGIRCPGCGVSRSLVELGHGDLRRSLAHHPLGWLILSYVVAQAFRHLTWLLAPGARQSLVTPGRWLDRGIVVIAALLLLTWIPTLAEDLSAWYR